MGKRLQRSSKLYYQAASASVLSYDNNYFNDRYQGIPIGGYTPIVEKMLEGCEVILDTDYFEYLQRTNPDIAR